MRRYRRLVARWDERWRWAIALVAGGLLMGIAPLNAWPLAWVAVVPLWRVVHRPQVAMRPALLGALLWGVAYHMTALSWVSGLHPMTWFGVPWLQSLVIMLLSWGFVTLWATGIVLSWMALMVSLSRWQRSRNREWVGISRVLVGTALWCPLEWLWSQGPLYWSSLSYTQSPQNLVGLHLGQLSGPLALTAAIVAVNGLLAEALCLREEPQALLPAKRAASFWGSGRRRRYWVGAIALFLGLHLLGLGLYSRTLADSPAEALAVGLVQGNIPSSEKMTTQGVQLSRQVYFDGYEAMVAAGADLVITPEGAIPQTWNAFLQARDLLQRAVVKNGVPLLLGTFSHEDISDSQTPLTQSLLLLTPDGKVAGRYNKVKLVPLGEYMPLESILSKLISRMSLIMESMAPGRFDQILKTPFGPMAAGICYDSAFPELFRAQVGRGGQAILTASNNDTFSPKQKMQHHAQDVMRAIETDRWEVRVTNTGISGVVTPKGQTLWRSAPDEYRMHLAHIYQRQTRTPYVRWGDWLTPLLLILAAVSVWR